MNCASKEEEVHPDDLALCPVSTEQPKDGPLGGISSLLRSSLAQRLSVLEPRAC